MAQAAVNLAKLTLEHTRILAPINGKIGRPLVPVGGLVTDAVLLATIDSVDPMCVAFDVDERTLLKLRRDPPPLHGEPGMPV